MSTPEPIATSDDRVREVLRTSFGHAEFRSGQEDIIRRILAKEPVLAVMPTGAGKSLCYQLPAMVLGGLTVVVSPLIALMNDQVRALKARGIPAASITSADTDESRSAVGRDLRRGDVRLLYVAPERFRSESFVTRMREAGVSLLAIDEAHCISAWGHDFRPDYARLGGVIEAIRPERFCALTATATPEVREDILRSLGLPHATTIVTGFDRPNLELSVIEVRGQPKKLEVLNETLGKWLPRPAPRDAGSVSFRLTAPGSMAADAPAASSAIVYVATRRRAEEVATELDGLGWRAAAYHAGLPNDVRNAAQIAFERDKVQVVVATNAFGMGVDKATVRCVVHYDVPQSTESYYQEVGRAGRDGLRAAGVLLYDPADLKFAFMRVESSCPSGDAVDAALAWLVSQASPDGEIDGNLERLAEALEPEVGAAARSALIALEHAGAIGFDYGTTVLRSSRASIDRESLDRRARIERTKLDAMIGYVQRAACRRRYLVDYFGDTDRPERCGICDRCALAPHRTLEGEPLNDVLKALSCVARMRGRYGRGKVLDVLLGSKSKPVIEAGLDQLSTYGLMKGWSREELTALLDSLARANLVKTVIGEYPRLELTNVAAEKLRSRGPFAVDLRLLRWGDRGAASGASPASGARARRREGGGEGAGAEAGAESPGAERLFEALREWRRGVAQQIAKPPYVVAHDATLRAVAALRPSSLDELSVVPGIGPAKLAAYGDGMIAVVKTIEREETEANGSTG